jgi:CID domain
MNDVLFHSTNTFPETKDYVPSAALQYLPALVKTIRSAQDAQNEPLKKVIKLWSEKNYFTSEGFKQITEEPFTEEISIAEEDKLERTPLIKPSILGNLGDPHWLLPVSCMLEVVVPLPATIMFALIDRRKPRIIINRSFPRMLKRSSYPPPRTRKSLHGSKVSRIQCMIGSLWRKREAKGRNLMVRDGILLFGVGLSRDG